ncbi:MAG: hypothetical protein UZ01_00387 [Candidatus Brocadia sinica]|nr:MAG: hypothetical protein UZ01_00387 [Candidatus Brocadia sinica]
MSWLNIRGKIYHCLKCPEIIKVEYEGGACLTQIGDDRVYEQMALTQRYGQPTANPDVEGYYLHDEVICETCFKERYIKGGQYEVAMHMEALCNRLSGIKDKHAENIRKATESAFNNWLENISPGNFREINTSAFDKTIGLKIFTLRGKRRDLIGQFVSSAKDSIIFFIYNQVNSDTSLQEVIGQYALEIQPVIENIKKLLADLKGKIFMAHRINKPENLNDYVRYEMTTRTPVESTPDTTVFYATDINKHEITGFLNFCDPSNQFEMDEDKWIGKLKNKLEA